MKITSSCVRCGKKIDASKGIYCPTCAAAPTDVTQTPKDRPPAGRKLLLVAVILLVSAVAIYAVMGDWRTPADMGQQSDVAGQPAPAPPVSMETAPEAEEPSLPAEPLHPEGAMPPASPQQEELGYSLETPQPPLPLADLGQPEFQPERPSLSADAEPQPEPAQPEAAPPAPETEQAAETATEEPTPAETAREEAVAEPEGIPSPVWLFFANDPGLDERIKRVLEEHGYTDVTAKGEWKTTYPVNYIFYRSKEREGLEHLASILDDMDFKVFHHRDPATSVRLRGMFEDNPDLEFVLILQ